MKNRHLLICWLGMHIVIPSGCGPVAKILSKGAKVAPKAGKGASRAAKGVGQFADDAASGAGRWGDDVGRGLTPVTRYADDVERQTVGRSRIPSSAVSSSARGGSRASSFNLARVLAKSKELGERLRKLKSDIPIEDAISLNDLYDAWQQLDPLLESFDRQLNDPDVSSSRKTRLEVKARNAARKLDEIERRVSAYD